MIRFADRVDEIELNTYKCAKKEYVICPEDDLFIELYRLFDDEDKDVYIPILNTDMQLVCLAYQYTDLWIERVEKAFRLLESRNYPFIEDLGPQIRKVRIFDMNEFAFRLYNILKSRHALVEIKGKRWRDLCPKIYKSDGIQSDDIQSENVYEVYAERIPCGWTWRFMYAILRTNFFREIDNWRNCLLGKGIIAYTMIFPDFSELDFYTEDEAYRNKLGIRNEAATLDLKDQRIVQQIEKCWKDGSPGEINKAMTVSNRHYNKQWILGEKSVTYKKYGGGEFTIYLIGPCIMASAFVDDEESLGACLYRELKQNQADYEVVCIASVDDEITTYENIIQSLTLYENDIVIMIDFHVYFRNNIGKGSKGYIGNINVKDILNNRKRDWFWDIPIHTNQKGNKEISRILLRDYLSKHIWMDLTGKKCKKVIQIGKCFLNREAEEQIYKYIAKIRTDSIKNTDIGSIVMNCNPMTNGHLYLIESALQYVKFIYIFLVEEDRSEIPFGIRYEIVKTVLQKYSNIKVVPSGKFVLSYETMPIYFEKAEKQEEIIDATKDLKIFGEKIASQLHIGTRFIGEEPHDKITKQYNEAMKKLLPIYGINVIEIPRLKYQDKIISASVVRKNMKDKKMDIVRQLIPPKAFEILENMIE